MGQKYDIPVGCCFKPTEQELIYLLKQAARGQPLETDQVDEKILYGDNALPWDVFNDNDHWQTLEDSNKKKPPKKFVFVLVRLSKMSAKKTLRTAGCGTWDGQIGKKPVLNNSGETIGFMKMLNFVLNPGCSPEAKAAGKANGYWIMHEYSLADEDTDYVICRITRDYSKYTKEKASASNKRASQSQEQEDDVHGSHQVPGKRKSSFTHESSTSSASKICRKDVVEDSSIITHEAVDVAQVMEVPNFVNTNNIEGNTVGCYDDLWTDGQQITYSDLLNEGLLPNGIFPQESVPSEPFYNGNNLLNEGLLLNGIFPQESVPSEPFYNENNLLNEGLLPNGIFPQESVFSKPFYNRNDLLNEGLPPYGIFPQESVPSEPFYNGNNLFPSNSGDFFDHQWMAAMSNDLATSVPTEK